MLSHGDIDELLVVEAAVRPSRPCATTAWVTGAGTLTACTAAGWARSIGRRCRSTSAISRCLVV
eukprot:608929-Alexandrium_andersonii.AAC.1